MFPLSNQTSSNKTTETLVSIVVIGFEQAIEHEALCYSSTLDLSNSLANMERWLADNEIPKKLIDRTKRVVTSILAEIMIRVLPGTH